MVNTTTKNEQENSGTNPIKATGQALPANSKLSVNPKDADSKGDQSLESILNSSSFGDNIKSDPLIQFFLKNGNLLLITCICAVLIYLAVVNFKQAKVASHQAAADQFAALRVSFNSLQSIREQTLASKTQNLSEEVQTQMNKSLADQEAAFSNLVQILQDQSGVYAELGLLYSHLDKVNSAALAGTIVLGDAPSPLANWQQAAKEGEGNLLAELSSLATLRVKLDSAETSAAAKSELMELAQSSKFVAVSAALTLARIATTPEERQQAAKVLQDLKIKQPEQAKILAEELQRLGT